MRAAATARSGASVRLEGDGLEVHVVLGAHVEVRSLRHEGDELLVAAAALPPAARVHGVAAGITLLHPWANRLSREAYAVDGVQAAIAEGDAAAGRDVNGLPIHGLAAPDGAWRWEETGARRAVARLDHAGPPGSPFPFPHDAQVAFALRGGRLEVTTRITPTTAVGVPIAFGWHPYLQLPGSSRGVWRLALPARRHLTLDARGLPTGAHHEEPADEQPLGTRAYDDGYDRVAPGALLGLRDTRRRVRLRVLDGYPVAQVFAPPAVDVVSLEPMTAPVDALVSGDGLRVVAPGETFSATFALDVRGYPGRR